MGQLNNDAYIHHFSHPHPLELTNHHGHNPMLPRPSCSGCTLPPNGCMYSCRACNYSFTLHASCAQLPSHITHPGHPKHNLTLLQSPAYPGGSFNCDACGLRGTAFCYHCNECSFDMHTTCASKPFSVGHSFHNHQLKLEFVPPYDPKGFTCDICRTTGSNHWLYRCASCQFDAHLDCATNNTGPVLGQPSLPAAPQPQLQPQPQVHLQHQHSYPGTYPLPQHHHYQLHHQNSAPPMVQNYQSNYTNMPVATPAVRPPPQTYQQNYVPPPPPQQQQNTLTQTFIDSAAQQAGQSLVQNLMGGGGGGGGNTSNSNGNDSSGGGSGNDSSDSSVIGSIFSAMFGGSD